MKELYGLFVKMEEEETKPNDNNNMGTTTYYDNTQTHFMQPQLTSQV
jgi:hypothetical protein